MKNLNTPLFALSILTLISFQSFGQSWQLVAGGIDGEVSDYAIYKNELLVTTTSSDPTKLLVKKLQSNQWIDIGEFKGSMSNIEVSDGKLYIMVGSQDGPDNSWESEVFIYDDVQEDWIRNSRFDGKIAHMADYKGKLVIAGEFLGTSYPNDAEVLQWDGTDWTTIGAFDGYIGSILVWQNQFVCAGDFTKVNNVTVNSMASWDGSKWVNTADKLDKLVGCNDYMHYLRGTHKGKLYTINHCEGGPYNYGAFWNGSSWTESELQKNVNAQT